MDIFPENVSTYGGEIDTLFWTVFVLSGIAFVISLFVLIYPLFRFRYKEGRTATYVRGTGTKQLKWVIVALAVLAASDFYLLYAEHDTWAKMEETLPEQKDMHIVITGMQYNWVYTYPGPDNELYTADDVIDYGMELHVPVNKNIIIDIKAKDVVHSLFLPNTRLKQDAIPGRTITRWFNITKVGNYDIVCAELCGTGHYMMQNDLIAESEEDFNAFIKELYANN